MVLTTFFVWKPEFDLGIPAVDAEPGRFFEIANQLHAATSAGAPPAEMDAISDELLSFASAHFAHEEQLLAEMHYIGVGIQRTMHERFMQELGNLPGASFPCDALRVLEDWMLNHILGTDRQYVAWMATHTDERGSATAPR